MKKIFAVLFINLLSISANCDDRDGFYLSFGLGSNSTDTTQNIDSLPAGSNSDSGITTVLKVGGYLSDLTAVYYVREAFWVNYNGVSTNGGLMGIGVTRYLNSGKSAYVEGSVGLADLVFGWNELYPDVNSYGGAAQFGIGTELTPNLQLGLSYLSTSVPDWYYTNVDYDSSSLSVRLELKK